jgi:hypothetical protein
MQTWHGTEIIMVVVPGIAVGGTNSATWASNRVPPAADLRVAVLAAAAISVASR